MIFLIEIYMALWTAISAYRDGKAERLRSKTYGTPETIQRTNTQWHNSGGWLYFVSCLPLIVFYKEVGWWMPVASALLIREMLFDLVRNLSAGEPSNYIGHSAWLDRLSRKWFGENGGAIKDAAALLILTILNIVHYAFY